MNFLQKCLQRLGRRGARQLMSENRTSQISIATATPSDDLATVLIQIKDKGWWQGSVIDSRQLAGLGHPCDEAEFWIVASQTCNLYNPSFDKVPVFEVVGSHPMDACS